MDASFTGSHYVKGAVSSTRLNIPASLSKGVPFSTFLNRASSPVSGVILRGTATYALPSNKLLVNVASKISPLSIAKAVAKAAFKPTPLLLLSLAGLAIDKYGDHILSPNDEWLKPEDTLYPTEAFNSSDVYNCSGGTGTGLVDFPFSAGVSTLISCYSSSFSNLSLVSTDDFSTYVALNFTFTRWEYPDALFN
ncbi:MAG: hypothetical protein GQ532_18440, partial [Methylomarinum sp.]|nr:hypothetical protein [Methylomarinum sp.]